jgi:hypothetical protein
VTPFFNSVSTLSSCIESVLAQSYTDFEYVILDNASTDGSSDLARAHPSVGVVGARRIIDGAAVDPLQSIDIPTVTSGREMARRVLLDEIYPLGSPTSVMYRADLVRSSPEFYDERQFLNDVDTALELLRHSDFGFCPQVLTFTRRDSESTFGRVLAYQPTLLNQYVTLRRRAGQFFSPDEAQVALDSVGRAYYETVLRTLFRSDRAAFLRFHSETLRDAGLTWDYRRALGTALSMGLRAAWKRLRSLTPTSIDRA